MLFLAFDREKKRYMAWLLYFLDFSSTASGDTCTYRTGWFANAKRKLIHKIHSGRDLHKANATLSISETLEVAEKILFFAVTFSHSKPQLIRIFAKTG